MNIASPAENRRYRPLLAAVIVDTVGEGMFMPMSFLYFVVRTHYSPSIIGLGITIAAIAALPAGLVAGAVIDRIGAKPVMMFNNLLSACGYVVYLFVGNMAFLIFAVLLVMVADRLYFASWPVLVVETSGQAGPDWLFSLVSKSRNMSLAVGYLAGGAVLALANASAAAYTIVLLNCVSSLIASIIVGRLRPAARTGRTVATQGTDSFRWYDAALDRPYLVLTLAQSAMAFAWLLPGVILPVYMIHFLRLPGWTPSAVLCTNFAAVATMQVKITRRAEKYRRTAVIGVAAVCLAGAFCCCALAAYLSAAAAVAALLCGILWFSFGEMLWNPAANALAADAAPAARKGSYMALFQMSWAISSTAGPALVGALFSAGADWLWVSLAAITGIGGAGFLLCGRLLPPAATRSPSARGDAPHQVHGHRTGLGQGNQEQALP